jgi:hypothetical protein
MTKFSGWLCHWHCFKQLALPLEQADYLQASIMLQYNKR